MGFLLFQNSEIIENPWQPLAGRPAGRPACRPVGRRPAGRRLAGQIWLTEFSIGLSIHIPNYSEATLDNSANFRQIPASSKSSSLYRVFHSPGPAKSVPAVGIPCFSNPQSSEMHDSTLDFRHVRGPKCYQFRPSESLRATPATPVDKQPCFV